MDILITGTTVGGIGYETAKMLLEGGHRVFIVCRDAKKTNETVDALAGFGKVMKAADSLALEDLDSVKAFAKIFKQDALDCLINNAGVMGIPELRRTKQGLENHVGINFTSHYLLTRLLLPKLIEGSKRRKLPSRIINVSSDAHYWAQDVSILKGSQGLEPYDAQQQYALSKLYQIWDTVDINAKYASTSASPNVISFALHPGVVSTNLSREFKPEALEDLKKAGKSNPGWVFLTPAQGALTTVKCATASLKDLQAEPPMKTLDQQILFYRDSARAIKYGKRVKSPEKVEEMVKATDLFLRQRSYL
jgi:NAD(P)-dependent dehydrogenase (short-subunit alcohol dehydrogenase family)